MTDTSKRQLNLYLALVALLVVAGLLVAGGIFLSGNTTNSNGTLKNVTVAQWGQEKYLIYLPLYVAIEQGYFQDQGLKVNITYTGNDDQTFAAVVSGDAHFGIGDPVFAAISQEKGYPAKVIATIVGGVAIWGITNNDDLDVLNSPEQMAGLRVGTFPSPSTNYTLIQELIEKMPASADKPTIMQAPIGGQLALLESSAADIAMVLEPAASLAEKEGYRVVYSSPKFHGKYAFTGVTTTQDYLESNEDTAQKFINAIEKAMNDCHADSSIAVDVGVKLFPNLERSVIERAVVRMIDEGTFPEHAKVDEQAWQSALQTRLVVGDLVKPQTTDQTVNNHFAEIAQSK